MGVSYKDPPNTGWGDGFHAASFVWEVSSRGAGVRRWQSQREGGKAKCQLWKGAHRRLPKAALSPSMWAQAAEQQRKKLAILSQKTPIFKHWSPRQHGEMLRLRET